MTTVRALRALTLTLLATLGLAAPAAAAEPIMPLSQIQKGMQCKGLSVVQGTEIVSFDVEILDVIAGDEAFAAPRVLISVSGPAVDRTGLGPGFSGSPIICRDGEGREAYAAAISESVGEYGGKIALATPMEDVVRQEVEPPVAERPAARSARALTAPLSIGGVSPRVGRFLSRLAAKEGQVLFTSPGRPRAAAFPVQELRPGAAMAVGFSSGALTLGGVGTVAYVDGDRVWSFGHPFDGAGRRSLFLQDAYVYTVINNPVGIEGVSTYKLAVPGHDVGVLSGDGFAAVAGRLGVMPKHFPMRVIANDGDRGTYRDLRVNIADENFLGQPIGISALALVGAATTAQAATTALGEIPARQSGEMCANFQIVGEKRSLGFCNRYVMRDGGISAEGGLGNGGAMVADLTEAINTIDSFEFATLDMASVDVNLTLRRGLRQAYMLGARGPERMKRGRTYSVRVRIQRVRGERGWRTVRVKVPRTMPRGERMLTLSGPDTDEGGVFEIDLAEALFGDFEEDITGPRTVASLRKAVGAIGRYDGVEASFEPPDGGDDLEELLEEEVEGGPEAVARQPRKVFRDPELRLSGVVRIPVTVR